jgi:hypothetical protein
MRGLAPSARTIPHLASRLKPVNAFEIVLNGARSKPFHLELSTKVEANAPASGNLVRISRLLLHCCNTREAIAGESDVALRSSLVIPFLEDQDKFTNKDPAPNRMGAGRIWTS